jgi:phage terminase large subunit
MAAVLKAAERPMRIGVYREIQRSIRDSAKRLLDDKIAECGLSGFYTSTDTEIRGANGSLFLFNGLRTNPDAIKSTEGLDLAIVMEANKVAQRSWDLLIPTVRKPGSELWIEWNPEDPNDPVDAMFRGEAGPPPGSIVREVNYADNPFFPDVLQQEMEFDRRRDPERHAHVWLGQYRRNSETRVFRNWREADFEAPADAVFRFGADWGFAIDPSVLVRAFIGRWDGDRAVADTKGRTLFIDAEAYEIGCEIDDTPALFAGDCPANHKALTWTNPRKRSGIEGSLRWTITADSSRPETVSYMKRHGFKIVGAIKGPGSVEDGIEFLRSFDVIVHPRCKHVAEELTLYSWKTDPATGEILPVLADKDNHCLVAGTRVQTSRGMVPIEAVRIGDRVMTRAGFRRVSFAGVTDFERETVEVTTTVGNIVCTPDHKVFTSRGMVRADALRYDDEVIGDAAWASGSDTAADTTTVIQRASARLIAPISVAARAARVAYFIATCGKTLTAQFRTAARFTTKIATPATTSSTTWSAYRPATIGPSTPTAPSDWEDSASTWTGFAPLPKSGTPAMWGGPSIGKSALWPTAVSLPIRSPAATAAAFSRPAPSETGTGSARTPARPPTVERRAWTTKLGDALHAAASFVRTGTARHAAVRGRVLTVCAGPRAAEVYDLTVEGEHEFFANGVLVSNCIDALRYAVEALRRAKPPTAQPASADHRKPRKDYRGQRDSSEGDGEWQAA